MAETTTGKEGRFLPSLPGRDLLAVPAAVAGLVLTGVGTLVTGLADLGPGFTEQWRWLVMLLLLVAFLAVLGRAVTGTWRGIVMNSRNLVSLSRFQALLWSVLVLSMFLALSFARLRDEGALRIAAIPEEALALLGGAGASAVFANGILAGKASKRLDPEEQEAASRALFEKYRPEYERHHQDPAGAWDEARAECQYLLARNTRATEARFRNMFEGDQTGNGHTIDFAKVQLFFFTLVVAIAFVAAFWTGFDDAPGDARGEGDGEVSLPDGLPELPVSVVGALAVSQSGYVASKAPDRRPTP